MAERLQTRDGRLRVEVLHHGLTMHRIEVDLGGQTLDLLAGPEDAASHAETRAFYGPVLGRYANRLPAASAGTSLPYGVAPQPWGGAPHVSLHGGPPAAGPPRPGLLQRGPWDLAQWTCVEPRLFAPADVRAWDDARVLALASPHMDQGFPGDVYVEALVGVQAAAPAVGRVHVEYRACLEGGAPATPLNMTQHWGFYLGDSASPSVLSHTLQLGRAASPLYRLAVEADGVPTGECVPTAGDAAHDWTRGKLIRTAMPTHGYDDFYVWGAPAAPAPVATLSTPQVRVRFSTDQAGVQLYTANAAPAPPVPRKRRHGGPHACQEAHGAVFLEFAAPHGTFLHPALARHAGHDTVLRAGGRYTHQVTLEIEESGDVAHYQPS